MSTRFSPRVCTGSTKTKEQIGRIFGLARKKGIEMDDEAKAGMALSVTGGITDRLSMLSFEEANALIEKLGGDPIATRTPRRTVNYHRQVAGVPQIAQSNHLKKMYRMAEARNMSDAGVRSLGERMIKHWPPRTTAETNKIIEALKAMNERDARKLEAA